MGPRYQWDKERARALLAEGKSDLATAEAVGCSVATLRSWKAREGLTKKRGEPSNTEQINAMAREARSQGLTYGELVARQSLPTVDVPQDLNKAPEPEAPPPQRGGADYRPASCCERGRDLSAGRVRQEGVGTADLPHYHHPVRRGCCPC